jgi:hypothetical protein
MGQKHVKGTCQGSQETISSLQCGLDVQDLPNQKSQSKQDVKECLYCYRNKAQEQSKDGH